MKNPKAVFFYNKEAVRLGPFLQKILGKELKQDFEDGLSGSKLVNKYQLNKVLGVSKTIAKLATFFALKGYDGSIYGFGKAYKGLLSKEVYEKVAKQHTDDSRKKVGKLNKENEVGIHAQTERQNTQFIRKALVARGITPPKRIVRCSEDEKLLIEAFMDDPFYKFRSLHSPIKISFLLKTIFPTRNIPPKTIRGIMSKLKRKKRLAA